MPSTQSLTHAEFLAKGHGKTAPWLDLVNSEEWDTYGKLTEWLDNPTWLAFFLRQWHFTTPGHSRFPAAKFKALRAALRKSCEALFAARLIPAQELRAINRALSLSGTRALRQRQNGLQVEFLPHKNGWDLILAQTALSFAETVAPQKSGRIKICLNSDCRWVFYDATKGRTRRWCSDKVCGNRNRVRRARARMAV
jgi:predicted RNA-binding Zn ribbon-like protein